MRQWICAIVVSFFVWGAAQGADAPPDISTKTDGFSKQAGYFPFYWDEKAGKIWLEISRWNEEFLYVNWLSTGLGSNPVGLDRGQHGRDRVVFFERVGPKVMLVQRNLRYRAISDDPAERSSVRESFAESVLWGAKVEAEADGAVLIDLTPFLLTDRHGVVARLKRARQGTFRLDDSRSAVYLGRTKNFPENTEFEATLTFAGTEPGNYVRQTAPTPEAVTLRQHHSFVALPDSGYTPRRFDPRAANLPLLYADYATPLSEPLEKRYARRHRLQKKDPAAAVSEAIEPIVYYVDRGAPPEIRQALLEGARWWNEAFEAAGYEDAFRVEVMPDDADPADVRYNIIQWVHRSTRGWSYGGSITDPRTGEILKGVVTLGSLRVRQDRMLFEGLTPQFATVASCGMPQGPAASALASVAPNSAAVDVALSRIRQLSAHEVGHTLGFAHNFAASTYDRGSVMDYPAPLVKITGGKLDISDAYDAGIGEWDKVSVRYLYSDFPAGTDERAALDKIIDDAVGEGLVFMSDADARPLGAAHPWASLWDNGANPQEALDHTMEVRRMAIEAFGEDALWAGEPLSSLHEVLVPLYLHHRYQVEAAAKMVGGVEYWYKVRGDAYPPMSVVPADQQKAAVDSLLATIQPEALALPASVLALIPPPAHQMDAMGERMASQTGRGFDPLAAARVAAQVTVAALLEPTRMARMTMQHAGDEAIPDADGLIGAVLEKTLYQEEAADAYARALQRVVDDVVVQQFMMLARHPEHALDVRTAARDVLASLRGNYIPRSSAHNDRLGAEINRFLTRPEPQAVPPDPLPAPPGSPIGGAMP